MNEIIMEKIDQETIEETSKKGWAYFIIFLIVFVIICGALIFSYKGPL